MKNTKIKNFYQDYLKPVSDKELKRLIKSIQPNTRYIYECDCISFQARIGITIDTQDLRELQYTGCPYCKKPFVKL